MRLLAELRRRNVIRMAGLYLVGAWLVVQVAETLLPIFHTPDWVLATLVVLLAIGFVPALVFSWVFELTPGGLRRESESNRPPAGVDATARKLDIAVIVLLLVVAAVTLLGRDGSQAGSTPVASTPVQEGGRPVAVSDAPHTAHTDDPSIAVLAFADFSPGKDQEYFSDGIAEEILNALVKVPGLRVAGRTSAFHFKGRNEDLRAIGRTLDVAHILEGSVRKQGDKVRITAQLIRSRDGFHLWSETYDGELSDVFALQERIARAITDELKVMLQGAQAKRLVNAGTANAEAYALYLEATAIFNRRDRSRFEEAFAQLREAITLDPKFARAWSRLATLHQVSGFLPGFDFKTSMTAVEESARRASELDPDLAEPWAALGVAMSDQRRYREQRAAFERALVLGPEDVTVHFWHGVTLFNLGYWRQGKAALDRALALDPLLPNALLWRGIVHVADGELDSAQRLLQRAADGGHAFIGLGFTELELARGNRAGAIEQLTLGIRYFSSDFPPQAPALFARACLGDAAAKTQALTLIDTYLASKPDHIAAVVPYVLIRFGEIARGFALMQDKPTNGDTFVVREVHFPLRREVRRAPEFAEFARRMGWAAYWDEFGPPDSCRKAPNGDYVCE